MKAGSWKIPLAAAALAAAAVAAYHGSFSGPFVYDDIPAITDNRTIRSLVTALAPPHGQGLTVEGRPVLNFSLAVNYAISGLGVWSYHALNLLIHLGAGLALFGIVRRTLLAAGRSDALWFAFSVALLWTVHPLQTEAVTYVIQRAESLMGLFYLLAIYCFVRGAETALPGRRGGSPSPRFNGWLALSCLCCLLGAGTKEVMATAPVMIFFFDRTFFAGSFWEAWRRRKTYYSGLAATWLVLAGLVASTGGNRSGSIGFGTTAPWGAYLLTQFVAVARYLRLSLWPHPLVFEYGTFWVTPAQAVPYALAVAALAAATLWALARRPALGFLGFWFFGILAPTSLVPGTTQMIVEHRMYLPLAAVIALGVAGLEALVRRPRTAARAAAPAAAP